MKLFVYRADVIVTWKDGSNAHWRTWQDGSVERDERWRFVAESTDDVIKAQKFILHRYKGEAKKVEICNIQMEGPYPSDAIEVVIVPKNSHYLLLK
jgi:hypothetical protein